MVVISSVGSVSGPYSRRAIMAALGGGWSGALPRLPAVCVAAAWGARRQGGEAQPGEGVEPLLHEKRGRRGGCASEKWPHEKAARAQNGARLGRASRGWLRGRGAHGGRVYEEGGVGSVRKDAAGMALAPGTGCQDCATQAAAAAASGFGLKALKPRLACVARASLTTKHRPPLV